MTCIICRDSKRVRLPTYADVEVMQPEGLPEVSDPGWREFDCPQCVPMVPYRKVRAKKLVTGYDPEYFGKFQMPIERSLAARFGEYLLREGLITFTQSGSKDFGTMADKIVVTAHLGVVTKDDTVKAGAIPEVAASAAPKLPASVRERVKRGAAKVWRPPPVKGWNDDPVTDEFDEPKDAIAGRFSGLEFS